MLRGIDTDAGTANSFIGGALIEGSTKNFSKSLTTIAKLFPVVLGVELASRTGLKVGDSAESLPRLQIFPQLSGSRRRVKVAGIFRSGLYEYDSTWIYIPLDAPPLSQTAHTPLL